MKKIIILIALILIAFVFYQEPKIFLIFERQPPEIELVNEPKGISATAQNIEIAVNDAGSGLQKIAAFIGRDQIFIKEYTDKDNTVFDDKVTISLDAKALGLKDNQTVELLIKAYDNGFVTNHGEKELSLKADFIRPRLEVLSVQHNGFAGGALMVFYKLLSDDVVKSGVKIGTKIYEGNPAAEIDPVFQDQKQLYFSLFPIPVDFNGNIDKVQVAAIDGVGNEGNIAFYQNIRPKPQRAEAMAMKKDFFVRKVNELLPKYLSEIGQGGMTSDAADMDNQQLADGFKMVNQNYRALLEQKLIELSRQSEKSMIWNGVFERPLAAKPTATFADQRTYTLEGTAAGGSTHMGVDLAQSANAEVRASNRGKVIFADDLGIYGNAVILDHGFGLITLYGHLSSIGVNVGETVEKLQKLGRTGDTGLAGGDHLHFEFRLLGQPVTPFEWLDPLWIKSHIEGQISQVKQDLGLVGDEPKNNESK